MKKERILIVPLGEIELLSLKALENSLEKKFLCPVEARPPLPVPEETYHPQRGQYHSSSILRKMSRAIDYEPDDKVLSITDVDLFAYDLNFVFGEAELGGRFAIISLTRLRQSFYGLRENESLFQERMVKEAVHEVGHLYGLRHCAEPTCVMHFSNSLVDTDRKSSSFCSRCQKILENLRARLQS